MLGKRRWLRPLARRYLEAFAGRIRPRHREVVAFLTHASPALRKARRISIAHWTAGPQSMQPVPAAADWPIPPIPSIGDLCDFLELDLEDLEWFADLKGFERKLAGPRLQNYRYQLLRKTSGDLRLIEAPKPRLKAIQRQILTRILDPIPHHPAAHGFVHGRSTQTFAAPHVGRCVVLRMDLRDFFPSFPGVRIQALFRTMGYPESVADLLGGLCTNAAPRAFAVNPVFARPHLPQGAPTSPALANLCSYRMDCRLSALAASAEAQYTRYADDLAFSGDAHFDRRVERFSLHVAAILHEEGFAAHHRKTRIMRQGVRQHLAGLVANERLNVPRPDFDLLKATLTNCVRLGPASQNRDGHANFKAHLEGRVGYVESVNPAKGRRLRAILNRIEF